MPWHFRQSTVHGGSACVPLPFVPAFGSLMLRRITAICYQQTLSTLPTSGRRCRCLTTGEVGRVGVEPTIWFVAGRVSSIHQQSHGSCTHGIPRPTCVSPSTPPPHVLTCNQSSSPGRWTGTHGPAHLPAQTEVSGNAAVASPCKMPTMSESANLTARKEFRAGHSHRLPASTA